MTQLPLLNGIPIVRTAADLEQFHNDKTSMKAWICASEPLVSSTLLLERSREDDSPLGAFCRSTLMLLNGIAHGDSMQTVLAWIEQAGWMQGLLKQLPPADRCSCVCCANRMGRSPEQNSTEPVASNPYIIEVMDACDEAIESTEKRRIEC